MTYARPDLAVKIGLKGQRGYTMKDIGFLDQRISQLEYYTVLNALTQDTQNLSITNDNTGLERFKNGIFVDPFNDSSLMRTDDPELRIGYSSKNSIARPNFFEIFSEYSLDTVNSSGVQSTGKLLTLSYSSEFLDGNDKASNYINCTGNFYNFSGSASLYPSYYMGVNRNNAVPQNITIDNTVGFNALFATGKFQNIDITQGNPITVGTSVTSVSGGKNTTTDYTRTDTKTITDIAVTQSHTSTFVNDNVVDVSQLPFIKSIKIAFVAYGLRPNTTFYPFFDKTSIANNCAPATLNPSYSDVNGKVDYALASTLGEDLEYKILDQNGNFGDPLKTDSHGNLFAIFLLPENTFKVGDRIFAVLDVSDINSTTAITSQASAVFTGATLGLTKQTTSFNIVQPTVISPTVTSIQMDPVSWSTTTFVADPPRYSGGGGGGNDGNKGGSSADPIWWGNDPTNPWKGSFGFADAGEWTSSNYGGSGKGSYSSGGGGTVPTPEPVGPGYSLGFGDDRAAASTLSDRDDVGDP